MILDLLKDRFSVRKFKDKAIPHEILQQMLEAARLSPSGGNEQAWVFGVVTDRELIGRISEASYGQKWIAAAPLVVVLVTRVVESVDEARAISKARFPDLAGEIDAVSRELYEALYMEEHQTKIPGTQMALAALEHGIGCTWVSYYNAREVARILHLPQGYLASNILAFGYPDEENPAKRDPRPRKRKLKEITFTNSGAALPPADEVPHWPKM
jgi:nitroreductase